MARSLLSHLEFAAAVVPVLLPVRLQLVTMLVFPDKCLWYILALAFVHDSTDVGIQGC